MNQIATIVLGFTLPFLMTTLGASLVFFFNKSSRFINMLTIGLAAGIMLSASIFSLLIPALENAQEFMGNLAVLPIVFGFILGAIFMVILDLICARTIKSRNCNRKYVSMLKIQRGKIQHLQLGRNQVVQNFQWANDGKHNSCNSLRQRERSFKLFTAITIHNIPEGMSVGFAIGTAVALNTPLLAAFMFALGIALQNFPEGLATALPIQNSLHHRGKAFALATLSGLVEPIFGIVGFFLAAYITSLLPWLLAFSAGAMIYVIVQEMIPEIHMEGSCSFGTWAFVIGFVLMMILDICL